MSPAPLLEVRDLRVGFATEGGLVQAVDKVSFEVRPGEVVAIVGESGSGKSVTAQTIMGLTRSKNSRIEGSVKLDGKELVDASDAELRRLRGDRVSMIFQDPMTSFNPVYKLGRQIAEAMRAHGNVSKAEGRARAIELFEAVGIPNADRRVDDYPHEFSGGMRQRAMIAMALALEPELLIADEPTTALDVTIQAQILDLILDLQNKLGTAVVLITHDLAVVAETAQRVIVMYAGKKVEEADVEELFANPLHPYTHGLMASIPHLAIIGGEPVEAAPDGRLKEIPGLVPALTNLPPGCSFAPRCPFADDKCRSFYPAYEQKRPGHWAACWHSEKLYG